jgi:uncharacterized protein DUF4231
MSIEHSSSGYEARTAFADKYFNEDLKKQRDWYSNKATRLKGRAELLAFLVILFGSLTTFSQVAFSEGHWRAVISAGLGALVVIAEGWKKITRYEETWRAYRVASERMKHECRLFTNGAGAYSSKDDDAARVLFIENIENIISEEQQIFWSSRQDQGKHNGVKSATK